MSDLPDLTARQQEIINLLPRSKTEIARSLGIKGTTVKGHIRRLQKKGVNIQYEDDENLWVLADERRQRLRRISTKSKQAKTREANKLIEAEETVLLRRLRQNDPIRVKRDITPGNESFMAITGDWHFGDVVESDKGDILYDMQVTRDMVERYAEKVGIIKDLEGSNVIFDECHLVITGDIATGTHIYEGQIHDIEAFLAEQVTQASQALIDLVITLADLFPAVHVHAVLGNHGLDRANAARGSNTDLICYRWTQDGLRRSDIDNVTIEIAESTHHLNFNVRNHRVHLRHGQDTKAHVDKTRSSESEWRGWRDKHRFDLAVRGHHHCPDLAWVLNRYPVITAPSPKRGGEYIERLGSPDMSDRSLLGWCVGVGDKRPLTFKRLVDDV